MSMDNTFKERKKEMKGDNFYNVIHKLFFHIKIEGKSRERALGWAQIKKWNQEVLA
jgi:hypothetical protein